MNMQATLSPADLSIPRAKRALGTWGAAVIVTLRIVGLTLTAMWLRSVMGF